MTRDEAVTTLKKRPGGLLGGSLESTVRTTLRGAYNHPSMAGTPQHQAAMTLAKEFGFTRFGNTKKATDLEPIPVEDAGSCLTCGKPTPDSEHFCSAPCEEQWIAKKYPRDWADMKKRGGKLATDLEPIPVEDAQRFAKRPKEAGPGDRIARCVRCNEPLSMKVPGKTTGIMVAQGVVHEGCASSAEIEKYMKFDDPRIGTGKIGPHHYREYMREARDAEFHKARLHRALDAVMDACGAARDAGSIGQHVQFKDPFTGKHESGEIVAKPARKPGDITGVWLVKTSTGKEIRVHEDRMRSVDSRRTARDAAGDYEVVWTDRAYKDHHKIFKNDSQGAPNNGEAKARKYAKQLESADSKDKYGNIRGPVNVRAVN